MCAEKIVKGYEKKRYEPPQPPKMFSFSRFMIIFLAILGLMIFIDPKMREGFATLVGFFMYPVIGFNSRYPVLTIFFAAFIMTLFSTVVRHIFIDWIEMARTQKILSAFNKERFAAIRQQNLSKLKKLDEKKVEITQMNLKSQIANFKAMAVTFFVMISIWTWLWIFIDRLSNDSFAVPWAPDARLSYGWNIGPIPCTSWILVSIAISIPLSQIIQRIFKHYSFKKKLEHMEYDNHSKRTAR